MSEENKSELNLEVAIPDLGLNDANLDLGQSVASVTDDEFHDAPPPSKQEPEPEPEPPKVEEPKKEEPETPKVEAAPTSSDSKTLDRVIIGFCLLVFTASTYLITDEKLLFNLGSDHKDLEIIAQVTRGGKDIRRRLEQDPVWYSVGAPDKIYQADSVFNGEKTDMEITFKDGSKISVNPGSLVVLRKTADGQNKLKVETGTITASSEGKGLVLESQGKEIKLTGDNAKAVFSVKRGEGASVAVVGGQATIKADGKVQTLQKDQVATADASGKITGIKTVPIQLVSPSTGSLIWFNPAKETQFAWTALKNVDHYVFQVASDYEFTKILYTKKTFTEKLSLNGLAGNKSYFWRVLAKPKQEPEISSMVGQFTMKMETGPRLLLPPFDRVLKVAQKIVRGPASQPSPPLLSVLLQWQDETGASQFKVQVSKTENFNSVTYENVVTGISIETPKLPAGKYFWRVKIQDAARPEAVWSRVSQFTVGESALEGSPVARLPRNLEQIVIKSKSKVRFQWDKREGAANYDLQVSTTPEFAEPLLINQNVKSVLQDWNTPKTGTYYWRVRGITGDGTATEFSQPSRFDIVTKKQLPAPQIIKPKVKFETSMLELLYKLFVSTAYAVEGPALEWQPVPGAAKYRIEISSTKTFDKVVNVVDVTNTSYSWPNPQPGAFYWRVSAVSEDGEVGQASEPGELNITTGPPTPVTAGTVAGKTTPEQSNQPQVDVDFKWSASRHARGYEIQIAEEPSFDGAVSKKVISNQEKIELPKSGKYFWRVRSLDAQGAPLSRFSEMKEIEIKKVVEVAGAEKPTPAPTPPPVIPKALPGGFFNSTYGKVQWNMPTDKIWHNRESINFGWTPNQHVKFYRLKVYKNADPTTAPKGQPQLIIDTTTRRLGHNMDHMDTGTYYAMLETQTTENTKGPSPSPLYFKVRRAKPVEFGHIDLKLSYGPLNSQVISTIVENNAIISGTAVGGTTQIEANTTFNDSIWGLKAMLNYNALRYGGSNLLSNDFIFAASARFDDLWSTGMVRPYFGGRAWSVPVVLTDQALPNGSYFNYYAPMLLGPVMGLEVNQKFGNLTFHAMAEGSLAMTNSSIGTMTPAITARPTFNPKIEVGVHFTPPVWDNFSVFGIGGISSDTFEWTPTNNPFSAPGNSSAQVNNAYVRAGMEILTDSSSMYSPKGKGKPTLFSDFYFSLGYSLKTLDYSLMIQRAVLANPTIVNAPNTYATSISAEGEGWFDIPEIGVRMNGEWTQFPHRGASLGYGETSVQLGFRPWVTINSGFELKNFFGLRSWQVPAMEPSGSGSHVFMKSPGLVGPANTLKLGYRFHPRVVLYAIGEVSYPLLMTNADTYMGALNWQFMSYRYEGNLTIGLSEDLFFGASYGVKTDQLNFYSIDKEAPSSSNITINSPVTSVFLMYSL